MSQTTSFYNLNANGENLPTPSQRQLLESLTVCYIQALNKNIEQHFKEVSPSWNVCKCSISLKCLVPEARYSNSIPAPGLKGWDNTCLMTMKTFKQNYLRSGSLLSMTWLFADRICHKSSKVAMDKQHSGVSPSCRMPPRRTTTHCWVSWRDGSCAGCLQRLARTSSKHPQVAKEQVALEGEEGPPAEPPSHLIEWPWHCFTNVQAIYARDCGAVAGREEEEKTYKTANATGRECVRGGTGII